jgi:hypothetical protein
MNVSEETIDATLHANGPLQRTHQPRLPPGPVRVTFTKDALSVALRDGRTITVPLGWYPRLFNATAGQRKNWQVAGGGYGIHWPDIDEDLSTEGLLRGAPAPQPRKVEDADSPTRRRTKRRS